MAVGRISGPLLKSNLIRNGIDLAFETDLLYLDVNNQRIGVRNSDPQHELDVTGTTRSSALEVVNRADIGDITIEGDTISSSKSFLNLSTLDSVVSLNRLDIDSISIEGNRIETRDSNADLEFRPNGTGTVDIHSDLNVDGNVFVTGNITADGNITIGDADTDNVVFNAEVASDIIPDETDTYNLGSDPATGGKEWADIFTNNLVASTINSEGLDVDGIDLTLRQGNIYYVAENGDDTNSGDHLQDPYASVKQALSVATAGDTVFIFPGEYTEEFPLEIPQGVTVKGHSLRSVSIVPTTATQSLDCFLLNGETTVEDLTIKDFFYDSVNNTGHAFRFSDSFFTVIIRSPYIRNVTVITQGSVTSPEDPRGFDTGDAGKAVFLDGAVATENSREASGLFNSCTFITPGVDAVTLTNGVRVEWLGSFTYFARRSVFAVDGTSGLKGSGETALRVDGVQGSFSAGETVEYYDLDGTTVLASAEILRVDADGRFFVAGEQLGFEEPEERIGKTVTGNGDAQKDTALAQHGTASLLLDGDGDFISINSFSDFGFGTNDFTIEGWFYPKSSAGVVRLFDFRAGEIVDNAVAVNLDGLVPEVFVNGSYIIQGSDSLDLNQWNHLAYVRSGTTATLYLNGADIGSVTDSTDYDSPRSLIIGALFDGSAQYFNGNIDDVRVVNGTAIVPPSGGPTFEARSTQDTVLLLRFDGEDGSQEFEDDTIYSQDIRFSGGATAREFSLVDFTDFGAEVRMISSASVYGDQGIVGDGAGVIIYAIGHNVSYIGSGKESTNDLETVIQANEFIELNRAKVRFSSVDQNGDFRVGELFTIDQDTGNISFTSAAFSIEGEQDLTFTDGADTTTINASKIETGNIRISGNTVSSLSGAINIDAFSDQINLKNSVNITGDLDVTGDVSIGGNITIGDSSTDTIQFIAGIDSDIIPAVDSEYSLGTVSEQWNNLFVDSAFIDDIEISDNYIQTTASNADLELRANGTGSVTVPENNVEITENLSVQGDTDLQDTTIQGDLSVQGAINHTGDFSIDGDLSVAADLTVTEKAQFEEILVDDNFVTTTSSNADLELKASGTGAIFVPENDVRIQQDLSVGGTLTVRDITSSGTVTANSFTTGNILIDDNFVTTTESNSDLELRANGSGDVVVPSNDVILGQSLSVEGATSLKSLEANGIVTQIGDYNQTGNTEISQNLTVGDGLSVGLSAQFENIRIDGNVVETTESNSDLELAAAGTGKVVIPGNDVEISNNLQVNDTLTAQNADIAQTVTADRFFNGNIEITDNFVRTTVTNSDLELRTSGTGSILVEDFEILDNIISTAADFVIQPGSDLTVIDSTGNLRLPVGTTAQRSALPQAGQIRFNTTLNRYEGYDGTYWIKLNGVQDIDGDTSVTAELAPGANDNIIRFNVEGNTIATIDQLGFETDRAIIDDLLVEGNVISTVTSNTDLELTAQGTGAVVIDDLAIKNNTITNTVSDGITVFENVDNGYVKFEGTSGLVIPAGDSASRPPVAFSEVGMSRFNTDDNRVEVWDGSNWISVAGSASGISRGDAEDIAFSTVIQFG